MQVLGQRMFLQLWEYFRPMPRYSDRQIAEALKRARGMVYVAAQLLGCSHNTIIARLAKSDKLRAVKEAEHGKILDTAELKLIEAVQRGDLPAIKYILSTQAKARGYVEKTEVEVLVKQELQTMLGVLEDELEPDVFMRIAGALSRVGG